MTLSFVPTIQVQAQFSPGTLTDISAFVQNFTITRPVTRLQGPLWQYQAGTLQATLDNSDGRFDPDNLAGPYISNTSLQQVVVTFGPGKAGTWNAPRNLSGTTIKVEAWGPGDNGTTGTLGGSTATGGTGGGGGEYAAENAYTVIPGNGYAYSVPSGPGSSVTFDGAGVVAHSGTGATGGTGSSNSVHFNGGAGAAGSTSSTAAAGGGGGSSASSAGAGNAGTAGSSGGAGGAAPLGGFAGGRGAPNNFTFAAAGAGPGGGGGGGSFAIMSSSGVRIFRSAGTPGGAGRGAQVRLTYFVTITPSATVTEILPMVPMQVTATWPQNFLTGQNTGFEGGIGHWVATSNCAVAGTSVQARTGTSSLRMRSSAAGTMAAADDSDLLPVVPGNQVTVSGWLRTAASPRQILASADFFDVTSTYFATISGTAGASDTTTGWTQVTDGGQIIAPAGAAFAAAKFQVLSAGAASEDHYVDDVVLGVTYPLFSGFADSWQESPVTYEGGYSEFILSATDGFGVLANNNLPATTLLGAGDDSGARVSRILDIAGWSPSARQIDTGDSFQQGTVLGASALSLLQLTADTEVGEVYVNGSGNVVFRHRRGILNDGRSTTPQAVFGDLPGTVQSAGTELAYAAVGRADDNTTLANDIQITAAGSANLEEAQDPVSEYVYQAPRSYVRSDLLLSSDAEAFQYASFVLFVSKNAENRFDTLTVDPLADTVNLYPQVLGREIGDRVEVCKRPPVTPSFPLKSATVATPGAFATIVSVTVPAGVYMVAWSVTLSGTLGGGDVNNFELLTGATNVASSVNAAVAGTYVQAPQAVTVLAGSPTITVASRGSASSGTYSATVTQAPVIKDVFVRGIAHTFDATTQAWSTTWTLQSATKYSSFLTLDSTVNGLLDLNSLGY